MKKILNWTLVAVVSLGGLAACGSDDDKSSSTTKSTEAASEATTGGEVASGNPAVKEFCDQVDDLAEKLKAVLADPTSADAASVTASASKLASDSAALITANPNDAAAINACSQKLTDALTP